MLHWLLFCCLKVNGRAFLAAGEWECCVPPQKGWFTFWKVHLVLGGVWLSFSVNTVSELSLLWKTLQSFECFMVALLLYPLYIPVQRKTLCWLSFIFLKKKQHLIPRFNDSTHLDHLKENSLNPILHSILRTFSRLAFALWVLLLHIFSADQIFFFVENDWAATEASSLLERREQQLPSSKLSIRVSSDPRQKGNVSKKRQKV